MMRERDVYVAIATMLWKDNYLSIPNKHENITYASMLELVSVWTVIVTSHKLEKLFEVQLSAVVLWILLFSDNVLYTRDLASVCIHWARMFSSSRCGWREV